MSPIGEQPTNDDKVQKLQAALRAKAKSSPDFRFYTLYDKVFRKDVLWVAFWTCRRNDGAPGVDGQTFADILDYGVDRWLDELAEELRTRTYQPQAVRRVYIPKPDGKQRPLAPFSDNTADDQGSRGANGGAAGARTDL